MDFAKRLGNRRRLAWPGLLKEIHSTQLRFSEHNTLPEALATRFGMLVIEQQHIFQHLNLHAPDVCGCALRCHGTSRTSDFTVNHSNKKTNTFF